MFLFRINAPSLTNRYVPSLEFNTMVGLQMNMDWLDMMLQGAPILAEDIERMPLVAAPDMFASRDIDAQV